MKSVNIVVAAVFGLALPSGGAAQDVRIQAGSQSVEIGNDNQFTNFDPDSYGRRLNRYRNNYGHNHRHNNRQPRYVYPGNYGYRNYDYYGQNYGRVYDYRNYHRSHPNYRYYNGYYSRPGFSIGGGSSRVWFGF